MATVEGTVNRSETMRRVGWRLLPFLMLLYLIAYIDRSNISVAALQMNVELGLTAEMYGRAAGIFFATYIIFEIPSNMVLAKVGARRWIARIMLTWGIIAAGMAFVTSANQLYGMRLLLGAAEAGFTPGVIYYLARWFPSRERANAMSFFYIGAALASVIGLPLSGLLLGLDGWHGMSGWRWLFLIEGIPAVLLAFVTLKFLTERPADASWLAPAERDWLERTLATEQSSIRHASVAHGRLAPGLHQRQGLAAGAVLAAAGLRHHRYHAVPAADREVGFGPEQHDGRIAFRRAVPGGLHLHVLQRAPFRRERRTGASSRPAVGPGWSADQPTIAYLLLALSVGLNWAAIPVFWAVTTEYVSGIAAAVSIALINAVANLAGLGLPPVIGWIKDGTGSFNIALLVVSAALMLGGVLGIALAPRRRATEANEANSLAQTGHGTP